MNIRYQTILVGALGLAFYGFTSIALADVKAGVTSAVNQQATGKPPTQDLRNLTTGLNVFRDEVIETSDIGQAQLLLNDGTALTVGPNVTLVIDEFVYDPETSSGELAMTLSKGVLRFVGGQLSKNQEVTITTPVATMGIRGGIAIISYDPVSRTAEGTFLFGDYMNIIGIDRSVTRIQQPGYAVDVSPAGTVGPSTKASPQKINAAMTSLEGRAGADGGATVVPTDTGVSQTVYVATSDESFQTTLTTPITTDTVIINDTTANDAVNESTNDAAVTPVVVPVIPNLPLGPFGLFGQALIQGQLLWVDNSNLNLSLVLPGGAGTVNVLTTPVAFNGGGAFAELDQNNIGLPIAAGSVIRVENINVTGAGIPAGDYTFVVDNSSAAGTPPSPFAVFLTGDTGATVQTFGGLLGPGATSMNFVVNSAGNVVVPPPPPPVAPFAVALYDISDVGAPIPEIDVLMIAKLPGNFDDPGATTRGLLGFVDFTGQDIAQESDIGVATSLSTAGGPATVQFTGTEFFPNVTGPLTPSLDFGPLNEVVAGSPVFTGSIFPATFDVVEQNFQERPFSDLNPPVITNFTLRATLTDPASATIGLNRRSETLQGYATGIFNARLPGDTFPGAYSLWNATPSPNDITATTNAANSDFSAVFSLGQRVVVDGVPNDTGSSPANITVNNMVLNFGASAANLPPGSTGVVANRGTYIDPDRFGALTTVAVQSGGAPDVKVVRVNGQFVPTDIPTELYLLTNATDPDGGAVGLLLPGQSFCTCPAAKFGWWGGAVNVASDPQTSFIREDRIHAGTFILGNLPLPGDLPVVGVANYAGHAAGVIRQSGVSFAATGGLTASWDFALRTGTAQITGFGGAGNVFDATLAAPVNGRDFTGPITSPTFPMLTGEVRGSFFATAADPSSDIGGVFRAVDPGNLFSTGAFAGTKVP